MSIFKHLLIVCPYQSVCTYCQGATFKKVVACTGTLTRTLRVLVQNQTVMYARRHPATATPQSPGWFFILAIGTPKLRGLQTVPKHKEII